MTDKQLDMLEQTLVGLGEYGRFKWLAPLRETLADYRRLRDLEQAVRVLWWRDEHGAYWLRLSEHWDADEKCAANAIGRLLEGER